MAKKIIIDGVIGWDVYASDIRKQLDNEKNDIIVEISSPGGSVFDGLEIFNILRDYSRNINKVTTKIMGLAASMASYIALAGDKVTAYDNAVYMIHNVWGMAVGDHRELQKTAEIYEQLTNLLAKAYTKKTGKGINEIRELMNNETWLTGNDIADAGFVDEIIESEKKDTDKNDLLMLAKGRVNNCISIMEKSDRSKNDLKKAAALIVNYQGNDLKPEIKPEIKMEVKKMDEKIQAQIEALTAENLKLKNQLENIKAHLQFADVAEKEVIENIKNEKPFNIECSAIYAKVQFTAELQKKREQDNPDAIDTPEDKNGVTESETNAYIAKLLARRGTK